MTIPRRRLILLVALTGAAGAQSACGGGDQPSGAAPLPPPPAPPPSAPAPAPAPAPPSGPVAFPLRVESGKRYLVDANGQAFLINGDTPWMIVNQCTDTQIDTYLNDRQARGFNAILFEAPGANFTTQTPRYLNVNGQAPFATTSYSAASFQSLNDAYWQRVDHLVNGAKARGIVCLFMPNYLGFGGGSGSSGDQGWDYQVNAASDANLQAYGVALALRYNQGNVIWIAGGDYNPRNIAKGWNIINGIRSVNPNAIVSFHGARTSSGYSQAAGQPGFNLNNTYTDGTEYGYCNTEYGRPGAMPFFHIEGYYEGDGGLTATGYRRQAYATILSGGCGHVFGHNELWGFGGYGSAGNAAGALANYLNTTGTNDMTRFRNLFAAYAWHRLEPKTDTSLVTTSQGSGAGRIIGARASDASFAMIWTPGGGFTVNMSALGNSAVRARWYSPVDGSWATVSGSPFANAGTRAFSPPGERVLVLDAG